jgi:hypothetical protein
MSLGSQFATLVGPAYKNGYKRETGLDSRVIMWIIKEANRNSYSSRVDFSAAQSGLAQQQRLHLSIPPHDMVK